MRVLERLEEGGGVCMQFIRKMSYLQLNGATAVAVSLLLLTIIVSIIIIIIELGQFIECSRKERTNFIDFHE